VTVIDPKHPLYGQTFRLIQIENRPDRGKCCLVEREWGHNSYLPLNATDQGEARGISSGIPLSVEAIRQLVFTYTRLTEDDEDGSNYPTPGTTTGDSSPRRVGTPQRLTEDTGSPDIDPDLPGSGSNLRSKEGKA
jgi:hypothetical protein